MSETMATCTRQRNRRGLCGMESVTCGRPTFWSMRLRWGTRWGAWQPACDRCIGKAIAKFGAKFVETALQGE